MNMDNANDQPQRKATRLAEYNYSTPSAYFVTICTDGHREIFGDVRDGLVAPSNMGQLALDCWREIPGKWKPIELDVYVVMPNHIHGILLLADVGGKLPSLGKAINWYKATVTKLIRKQRRDPGFIVWQRNYYDHIVRDDDDLARIRDYIALNPGRWEEDEFYAR